MNLVSLVSLATPRVPAAPPTPTTSRTAMKREAERVVKAWREDHGVPGIAISIRDSGNAILDIASGVANLRSGRKLSTSDRFFAASTTKMGTAALVLKLAEQGRLDLDSKLAQWFPEIPNAKNVTIRSLLKHKAGVPSADRHPDSPAHADIAKR